MTQNELKTAMADHVNLGGQIASLQTLLEKSTPALAKLEATGDLENAATLAKIGALQVQVGLLPSRLEALEAALNDSYAKLVAGANKFFDLVVVPKIGAVRALAVTKVEKTISALYSSQEKIIAANKSADVQELNHFVHALGQLKQSDPADALEYTQRRLAALDRVVEIEKSL
jgi:hypothetical protein